jgi:hypothetical protein
MAENTNNTPAGEQKQQPQQAQDINQLLKVRREKLAQLQAEGKDPV